eukprot:10235997-Alexandrium_andersonii.AAC.1
MSTAEAPGSKNGLVGSRMELASSMQQKLHATTLAIKMNDGMTPARSGLYLLAPPTNRCLGPP